MRKSLFLLRHARAMEKVSGQKDTERQLNAVGLQNASRMGMKLSQEKVKFDMILSSSAARALATATLVAEQVSYDPARIHTNQEIYEASVRSLLQTVNNYKKAWKNVLLVGHNPAISYLAEYISDGEIGSMDTCGLVQLEFEIKDWMEVSQGSGKLVNYFNPELLNF